MIFIIKVTTNKEERAVDLIAEKVEGVKVIVPDTFMNHSGKAVTKAVKSKKAAEKLIVIYDDLDLPLGTMKISYNRSSGGHRGVQSIIDALKTTKFFRIRIGTGVRALDKAREQSEKKRDEFVKEFVLKKFTPAQHDELK